MIAAVLTLFDAFAWLLGRLGVDYPQFRALLLVKLTLDGRRRLSGIQQQKSDSKGAAAFGGVLFFNALMGLFIGGAFVATTNIFAAGLIVHAFVMLMMAMTLVADFSSVLLDTTDNRILQPRPVTSRTLFAARTAHIATYITLLAFSLSAAAFVFGAFRHGPWFVPIFALTLLASIGLTVSAVNILYLLVLRIASTERLRDIILYFQVAVMILFVGGYQIVPRLVGAHFLENWDPSGQPWIYWLPPAWLAGPLGYMKTPWSSVFLMLTVMCIAITGTVVVLSGILAPGFKAALARLESTDTLPTRAESSPTRRVRRSRWIARDPLERAAFDFLAAIASRDRQFKLRTYPNVAIALIIGVVMLFNGAGDPLEVLRTLGSTQKHLFLLYAACIMAPSSLVPLRFSDKWEAAWIYQALPLPAPGVILRAAFKVVLLRLMLPLFVLIASVVLLVWGPRALPDILLTACVFPFLALLHANWFGCVMPFSRQFAAREGAGRMMYVFVYLFLAMALGWLHYGLTMLSPWAPLAATPIAMLALSAAWTRYGRVTWQAVQS